MKAILKSTSDQLIGKKKGKDKNIEKKVLILTKCTYITALLFHIVATQIQALVLWNQLLHWCCQGIQQLFTPSMQSLLVIQSLIDNSKQTNPWNMQKFISKLKQCFSCILWLIFEQIHQSQSSIVLFSRRHAHLCTHQWVSCTIPSQTVTHNIITIHNHWWILTVLQLAENKSCHSAYSWQEWWL